MGTWRWRDVVDHFQKKHDSPELKKSEAYRFKQRAYAVVIGKIRQTFDPKLKVKVGDIAKLNATDYMRDKIRTLIKSDPRHLAGTAKSGSTRAGQNAALKSQLVKVPGIGEATADHLIKIGLRNVGELQNPQWFKLLSEETKLHLTHTPEEQIPHEDIARLEPILIGFDPKNTIVAGSYRRMLPFSRDIDVILVSEDPDVLDRYLEYLQKYIPVWVYAKGRDKMSFIIGTGRHTSMPHTYKLDVLRTHPDERWPMLLYLTGSKAFNIRMRSRAMRLGYLLNQNGLFDQGRRIPIDSEKGYFDALGMEWVPPEKRW